MAGVDGDWCLRWGDQQLIIQRGQQFIAFKQLIGCVECDQLIGQQFIGRWQLCITDLFSRHGLQRKPTGPERWQ